MKRCVSGLEEGKEDRNITRQKKEGLNNFFNERYIIIYSHFYAPAGLNLMDQCKMKQSKISLYASLSLVNPVNGWHISCMLLAQYLSCNPLIIMIIIIMARSRNQYTDGTGCNGKKRINDESQGFISWHCAGSKAVRDSFQKAAYPEITHD